MIEFEKQFGTKGNVKEKANINEYYTYLITVV